MWRHGLRNVVVLGLLIALCAHSLSVPGLAARQTKPTVPSQMPPPQQPTAPSLSGFIQTAPDAGTAARRRRRRHL
jgi:hypothetical protein